MFVLLSLFIKVKSGSVFSAFSQLLSTMLWSRAADWLVNRVVGLFMLRKNLLSRRKPTNYVTDKRREWRGKCYKQCQIETFARGVGKGEILLNSFCYRI